MRFKQRLRYRITLTLVLFGTLLSSIIVAGLYGTIEDVEKGLVQDILKLELSHFAEQHNSPPGTFKQISADSTLYYVSEAQKKILPEQIRYLPAGYHEVNFGIRLTYDVLVSDYEEGAIYIVKNATSFERLEFTIRMVLLDRKSVV